MICWSELRKPKSISWVEKSSSAPSSEYIYALKKKGRILINTCNICSTAGICIHAFVEGGVVITICARFRLFFFCGVKICVSSRSDWNVVGSRGTSGSQFCTEIGSGRAGAADQSVELYVARKISNLCAKIFESFCVLLSSVSMRFRGSTFGAYCCTKEGYLKIDDKLRIEIINLIRKHRNFWQKCVVYA